MENGWVKIHRKLLENPFMRKPAYISLWVTLLLKANHKDNKFMWNHEIIVIKEGQFITSRDELSKVTGIHRSSIERILETLENEHQIEQQKTTKYRLITIVNWKEYQNKDNELSNKRATNEQQMSTNKNDNNDKNEKKYTSQSSVMGKKSKKGKNFSPLELSIYTAFKESVNENIFDTVANWKIEREACKTLFNNYGQQIVLKVITDVLPKTNLLPGMPQIYTPAKLLEKWAQLSQAKDRKINERMQVEQKQKDKVGKVYL